MCYLFKIIIFLSTFFVVDGIVYDRYSGQKVDVAQAKEHQLTNAKDQCWFDVKPCTPHEGRRVDGTCNNYKYPTKGAAKGPYLRLLKPDYANNRDIRMNRHSKPLPSARRVRTNIQTTGRVVDKTSFNIAAVHMIEFVHRDISVLDGPRDYLRRRQHCCDPAEESTDLRCMPIRVPEDDPYLKVTDIRCLNFSRAETFQDAGCTPEIIPPEQINFQTPVLDLSTIYGVDDNAQATVRKWEKGLLKLEKRNNRYVPLLVNNNITNVVNNTNNLINNVTDVIVNNNTVVLDDVCNDACTQNRNETNYYQFGFPEVGNFDLRTTTLTIFFMREHNRLAQALHHINPCWKDDRLFKVARQINIGTASNIFMYELLPALLGYRNMLNYGLISEHVEHVSAYDQEAVPLVYAEYEIAVRYFHTLFDGRIKKYSEDYHYITELSFSNTLFRQVLIEQNKNFEEINRGTFLQHSGKIDDIQDPEISEKFYGSLQRAHDWTAIDIQRGRDMGVRGYNDYRHICGLKPAKTFDDFLHIMEIEKVEVLKILYDEVDDVDLLAGVMSETHIQGTHVGPTLFCIMAKQLQLFRFADRFWYERGDQLHSLTLPQLHEIRKTNMARFACDNAEAIKHIQPQAFLNVRPGNTPVPCSHIPGMNLKTWRDDSCFKHKYSHEATHVPITDKRKHVHDSAMDFTSFFDHLLSYEAF